MIVYLLVVWFGSGYAQSTFSVPDIQDEKECHRLADIMKTKYRAGFATTSADCYPYRKAK